MCLSLSPLTHRWYSGHDLALQGFGRKKQWRGAMKLAGCFIVTVTAVWHCALWQLPAAILLVAKTIGSRWLCPIVPWNSFTLKRWNIVLVADSLQENETPCTVILWVVNFTITAENPNMCPPRLHSLPPWPCKSEKSLVVFFSDINGRFSVFTIAAKRTF